MRGFRGHTLVETVAAYVIYLAVAAMLAAPLLLGCAATFVVGDASAKLCHTDDGGTLSDNAVKAAAAAAAGAARGALGGGLPDFSAEGPSE